MKRYALLTAVTLIALAPAAVYSQGHPGGNGQDNGGQNNGQGSP